MQTSAIQPSPETRVAATPRTERLTRLDYVLLLAFCALLFGYSAISGRPLSMHEARLPQCSREMMANGDYLIPRSGHRPWLERPPLPHWITVGFSEILGQRADNVWVVRLPAALMGCATILLCAWIAGTLFGRRFALASALVLSTMYEFYTYSSLAEDDIFLAALVAAAIAIFVRIEFAAPRDGAHSAHFLGTRRPAVLAFFALTGLTSMTKGPLLGVLVIAPTVAAFLLWTGGLRRLRQYVWLWGWLVVVAVTLAWPAYVYHRYPDVMENWLLDYARTKLYDEPFWYYGPMLLMALLPWTPAALLGLWLLARKIRGGTLTPAERFAFCWAVVSIVALSLPHRKHHHYLVPSLAPWALVTAYGLFAFVPAFFRITARSRVPVVDVLAALAGTVALWLFRTKIPGPPWVPSFLIAAWLTCLAVWYTGVRRQNPRFLMAAVILGAAVTYSWGQSCLPDGTTDDTAFLRQVDATVPQDQSLMVNADLRGDMDFFRNCFYLRPTATLLHNLSFLRDEQIRDPDVYVVTRANDRAALQTLGQVDQVLQSPKTRREKSPDERFTLFHVTFRPDLARYPAPPPDKITTIQAMGRKKGPYCGPDWPPQLQ